MKDQYSLVNKIGIKQSNMCVRRYVLASFSETSNKKSEIKSIKNNRYTLYIVCNRL